MLSARFSFRMIVIKRQVSEPEFVAIDMITSPYLIEKKLLATALKRHE